MRLLARVVPALALLAGTLIAVTNAPTAAAAHEDCRPDGLYKTAGVDVPYCTVYDTAGRPCPRCGTPIRVIEQAAELPRLTYWCPACQADPRNPA